MKSIGQLRRVICRKCEQYFTYFIKGPRPRWYCDKCVEIVNDETHRRHRQRMAEQEKRLRDHGVD